MAGMTIIDINGIDHRDILAGIQIPGNRSLKVAIQN